MARTKMAWMKTNKKKRSRQKQFGKKNKESKVSVATASIHGVMEGGGSYNRHARVPAGGANLALPLLKEAVGRIALENDNQPVVVADYGSSQGKNSLAPMRAAIQGLRQRVGAQRPIHVVHIDQPANDFNSLFGVLHADPECYAVDDANVFPSAIGRSFYESVLPKKHVHLGWSSYAAVWLSQIPMTIPGHFISVAARGEVRAAFDRQGADDWKSFLALRAQELRPGGRLVVVLPGLGDDGESGFEPLFDQANQVLAEMVSDRVIAADERARMVLGTFPRRRGQLLEPFKENDRYHGLMVERCELFQLRDAAWEDYERDGEEKKLIERHVGFFRSIFVPSLSTSVRDGARQLFVDEFSERLTRRLSERPAPYHSFTQTMVLAREKEK
jgi:SAM dependent carboxyl methyltransferase